MKIYPAIDVKEGKVVRLMQGRPENAIEYSDDPLKIALKFAEDGAEYLHIVNLDGAFGQTATLLQLITEIAEKSQLRIQTGGGIRDADAVADLLQAGADRVVIGSMAVTDPTRLRQILERFGPERITLAIDVRCDYSGDPLVATHGWKSNARCSAFELLRAFPEVEQVLCTDIERDGMLSGPNLELYESLSGRFPATQFLASGGVSDADDVVRLQVIGVGGAIIGRALYEGAIQLKDVLPC